MATSMQQGEPVSADSPEPTAGGPPRRGLGGGRLLAATLVALLLGLTAGLLVPRFLRPGDDSAEAGFLRDMSTHHAQAVEMAMIAHARTTNPDIRTLAADIALTQHGQIGMMLAWLRGWDLEPTGSRPPMAWMPDSAGSIVNGLMPGMATPDQMAKLRAATGKDLDVQFLQLMRPHHIGGIHMAQEVIRLSDDKDVTWLAQTMVSGQQGELNLMQSLLTKIQATP